MKKIAVVSAITLLFANAAGTAVGADGRWHGDIQHFEQYDATRWHGGYWTNSVHGGRNGWWWVVDTDWYFYPAPVYPYPDPYIPYAVISQAPVAGQYWFCPNPSGYYPYVSACYGQWQPVAAASVPQAAVNPAVLAPPKSRHDSSLRDQDDRQLNAFAGEFFDINASQKDALQHLRNLKARVDAFHQTLSNRRYNAMDILKDVEDLQSRVEKKEAELTGAHPKTM